MRKVQKADLLVVMRDDDNRSIFTMIASNMKKVKSVLSCRSSKVGMQLVKQHRPSLVIIGNRIHQDKKNWGVHLVKKIKGFDPKIKTILTSTNPVLDHDADDFLIMPFDPGIKIIKKAINKQLRGLDPI